MLVFLRAKLCVCWQGQNLKGSSSAGMRVPILRDKLNQAHLRLVSRRRT